MPAVQTAAESSFLRFFHQIAQLGLIRSLVQLLRQVSAWGHPLVPVENIGSRDWLAPSPNRPVRHAKKRLGRVARFLFAIVPSRFQHALGYLPADSMGQSVIPEEIKKTPINPSGKGNKRKQDDVALEEHLSWVEVLQGELLEEDETEDPTYEPTPSELDSEEYRSQNDTETDLEFEERDDGLVLKESPNLQGENGVTAASRNAPEQQAVAASGGNGGEAPEQQQAVAASGGNGGEAPEQQAVAASGGNGGEAPEQQAVAASGGNGGEAPEQQAVAASGGNGGEAPEQRVEVIG